MSKLSKVVKQWVCLLALFAASMTAQAQASQSKIHSSAWPSQAIRIIVTFTPGGAPDILARVLAENWQKNLGVPVLVENRPATAETSAQILLLKVILMAIPCLLVPSAYMQLMGRCTRRCLFIR